MGSIFYFSGQNNLNDFSALYDGFGGGSPSGPIEPSFELTDPMGDWILNINIGTVPDASSSLELLAGSMTALAGGASFLRRRSSRKL